MKEKADYNLGFVKQADEINAMFLAPILPAKFRASLPHFVETWLRNWIANVLLYFFACADSYLLQVWKNKNQTGPCCQYIVPDI
jgi:hypothetical protein